MLPFWLDLKSIHEIYFFIIFFYFFSFVPGNISKNDTIISSLYPATFFKMTPYSYTFIFYGNGNIIVLIIIKNISIHIRTYKSNSSTSLSLSIISIVQISSTELFLSSILSVPNSFNSLDNSLTFCCIISIFCSCSSFSIFFFL